MSAIGTRLAEKTADAFSYDRYGRWQAVVEMLLRRGLSVQQAEAVLRSKWTRWAADASDKPYGKATSHDLARFIDQQRNAMEQIAELTRETFGMEGQIIHAPATPLPWTDETTILPTTQQDALYSAHAANAYPKLIYALRSALSASKGDWQRGASWDKAASALLRELGEAP